MFRAVPPAAAPGGTPESRMKLMRLPGMLLRLRCYGGCRIDATARTPPPGCHRRAAARLC